MTTLTHPFKVRCHDLPALIGECSKLSTFCSRLEKQADWHPDRYDRDKYVGDGFELLIEALIKLSPVDNRIAIGDYQVVTEDDLGVDGVGKGINGKVATVQCKYRSNSTTVLTANQDHLSNFVMTSLIDDRYGVDKNDTKNMIVFTTAKGMHHFTDAEMFKNKVRCLGYEELRGLLDNNELFWHEFRRLCSNVE